MNQEIKVMSARALVTYDSVIAKSERNDCMVYALATSFDLPYDQAHQILKERFERVDRCGTRNRTIEKVMTEMMLNRESLNGKSVVGIVATPKKQYHSYGEAVERRNKLKTFIKDNPQDTFLILVRGHALTVKGGTIIDTNPKGSGNSYVIRAYKIVPTI